MCHECAQELRKQTSKCPICRNQVESLLHIKMYKVRGGGLRLFLNELGWVDGYAATRRKSLLHIKMYKVRVVYVVSDGLLLG